MLQLAWRVNNKRAQQLDEVSVPEGDVAVVQCNRSGKWATRVACLRSDDATPALFSPGSLTRIELGCRDVESKCRRLAIVGLPGQNSADVLLRRSFLVRWSGDGSILGRTRLGNTIAGQLSRVLHAWRWAILFQEGREGLRNAQTCDGRFPDDHDRMGGPESARPYLVPYHLSPSDSALIRRLGHRLYLHSTRRAVLASEQLPRRHAACATGTCLPGWFKTSRRVASQRTR
jgi:hypothetical protein